MNMQYRITPSVRPATTRDIPFIARMDLEASKPPFGAPFWDELLQHTNTGTLRFLEAMFCEEASNWGNIADFIILQLEAEPVAACAVFKPDPASDQKGPLNLDRIDELAWALSWPVATKAAFKERYETMWRGDTSFLAPQADVIIESVAVAPDHRGQGLGTALMHAAFDKGRHMGADSIGIMVIHGNDGAQALYEKHFERHSSFYAAHFDHTFPGVTKYRAPLFSRKE